MTLYCVASPVVAATAPAEAIRGATTTQDGTVQLPGVEVTVTDAVTGRQVAVVVSDGSGKFRADGVPPGQYRLVAHLSGFVDATTDVVELPAGGNVEVAIDLKLAPFWERVNVVGTAGTARLDSASTESAVKGSLIDVLPVMPGSFQAVLPVLPGVVRGPSGQISLKGSQPTQGALLVGQGSATDPSTGHFGLEIPGDSVESVEVVANPYRAREGRFSAGLVKVETRAGTNDWHASARGLVPMPCLKMCDGHSMGIRRFEPRIWAGGPIVRDRLFLAQGVEYHWNRYRVPSLPEDANDITRRAFEALTRVDANLAPGQTLSATAAAFSRQDDLFGLNTFTPAEATPNLRLRGTSLALSATSTISPATVLESSVSVNGYRAGVWGQGEDPMVFTPLGRTGHYFNAQVRRTHSVQWTESLTRLVPGLFGEHLLNAGFDLMHAGYTGTSRSRSVIVRRSDGTASERVDFGGPTSQRVAGTDFAVYLQDRWRPTGHLLVEPGVRVDRDGVLRQTTVSPRVGLVLRPFGSEASVVRGGVGVFTERTPLNVGAFESFEAATVTRFEADGATVQRAPVTFTHVRAPLATPRALVWNVEVDHRIGTSLFVKVNHLRRQGAHEAIVDPVEAADTAELRLESRGRSRYVETEVTVRYGATEERRVTVSYVRSRSTADSNAFDAFFGNLREPLVRSNEHALAAVDVPNRLLVSAILPFRQKWTASTMFELRDGFPYSAVDEAQHFVGTRHTGGRFPIVYTLDARLLRTITVKGRRFRIGIRANHLLNTFWPRDVQGNTASPDFGRFFNSYPRLIAFTGQWTG